MTLSDLETAVLDIVQDTSFDGMIAPFLNRGMMEVAGSVDLPDLVANDTVATSLDGFSVDLPDDYHKGLFFVGSAAQKQRIGDPIGYRSYSRFLRRWPDPALDKVGPIEDVSVKGATLVCQPRAADTLTLQYYRTPETMVETTDVPDGIPAHLHEPLLVHYACREIWARIEDGIAEPKNNAIYHHNLYVQALSDLKAFIGTDREPQYVQNEAGN